MDGEVINRALRRIAHEIIERNPDLGSIILAGIPSRGAEIARRIAAIIEALGKPAVQTGVIDISMHRDDVGIAHLRLGLAEPRFDLLDQGFDHND